MAGPSQPPSRKPEPRQLVFPGMGRAQFPGKPDWHLNEAQFNDKFRAIRSFDDLEHGQPAILQAYHGTSPESAAKIRQHGFQPDTSSVAINRKHGLLGIEQWAQKPRVHLLSSDEHQGVYFAEHEHAREYMHGAGSPHPVEVRLKNPRVDEELENYEIQTTDPDDVRAHHDAWIARGGSSGASPIKTNWGEDDEDDEDDDFYGEGGEHNTGEPFRQGVVFNPSQIRMLPEGQDHAPLRTPVTGAEVRHRKTGERAIIANPPGHRSDSMEIVSKESGFPHEAKKYTGEPYEFPESASWKDYEVVGGHGDFLREAQSRGRYVPARAWEPDQRLLSVQFPDRRAVGEQQTAFDATWRRPGMPIPGVKPGGPNPLGRKPPRAWFERPD